MSIASRHSPRTEFQLISRFPRHLGIDALSIIKATLLSAETNPIHLSLPVAAIDGLPQQAGEGKARILGPRVRQVLLDEFAEAQPFVQLQDQNQTSTGSDSRPLPALSSRMNTGDADLLHPYHRFSNRKSGLIDLWGTSPTYSSTN